jgi:hypothetical protein
VGSANAQWSWAGCGGNLFNTCASVNITYSGGVLTMVVQNWGTYNPAGPQPSLAGSSIFTQLGLGSGTFGSGALTGLNSFSCAGGTVADPTCDWVFDSGLNGLPGYMGGARYAGPPSGHPCNDVNCGLNPPGSPGAGQYSQVTLVFSTSPVIDLSAATFGLHGQAGPSNCSTKLFVTKSGSTYSPNTTTSTTCAGTFNPPTETPVPEPASMVLLATGLVAMSGAGIIRRRRNRKV